MANAHPDIPGYAYGNAELPASPVTLDELDRLKQTLLLRDDDRAHLRRLGDLLKDQTDDILDVWYGFVGDHPHLVRYFADKNSGEPDADYMARVRWRFGQWILDTARADYDQVWLDYQYEIGRRHHRVHKNDTDGAGAPEHIPLRYVLALAYPISATIEPFLQKKTDDAEAVKAMMAAWTKAVLLQAILWSQPYVKDGDF